MFNFSIPPIDFFGQARVEFLLQLIVISFSLVAFAVGFYAQSMSLFFRIFVAGLIFSFVMIVPSWRFLRRHPIKFVDDSSIAAKSPKK
ncbi:hypothetical protein HMI54_008148 [Coelomomyces lativittatus]|nr:hypothetical protein HMI54_008148 [Coelomomyces lativittatus]